MVGVLFSQNRVNYSQYMHNHQVFNPAYVSEANDVGGSVLYRNQWMGIQGAPTSFIADVYGTAGASNFNLQFLYDQITIFKHLEAGLSYSYSIKIARDTKLALGLKGSYNQQTSNYGMLSNLDAGDPNLSGLIKKSGFNMGFGIFARNKNWHAGLGAPYLFNNGNIEASSNLYNDITYQHFFLTGGYRIVDEKSLQFYPTAILKWAKGSPLNVSLDFNFLIYDLIWGSFGYRTDNTLVLSTGVLLWKQFKLIYSYDLGLGRVNKFGGMTHEISMGYGLDMFKDSFTKKKYVNRKGGRMRPRRGKWK